MKERPMRKRCLSILGLLLLVMSACQVGQPETGAAAVRLRFSPPPAQGAGTRGVLSGVVDTVRVTVSHGGKQLVEQSFDYEHNTGTIQHIPAGGDRVFLAQALSSNGEVVYEGTRTGVTIAKNQTATVSIDMEPAYTVDTFAPAAVDDLSGQASGADVILSWTATGDDGRVNQAASYDLRRSESTIQASNFDSATPVTGLPSPAPPDSSEQFTVTGLTPGIEYHFAIKVIDDDGNTSAVSNEARVTTGGADTTPPAAATLSVDSMTDTTVTLSWTAPGDDGTTGTAAVYDVRYLAGSTPIDAGNWAGATEASGEPTPQAPGSFETFTVTGLTEGQQYYFAMKTGDEVPNWSDVSNSVEATPADTVAPAAVTDLSSPSNTETSVTLEWTAPGDDGDTGTADHYDIRYLQGTYNQTEFDADWASATIDTNAPDPQAAGGTDTTTIDGLATGATYTFALKAYDEVPNESPISNVVTLQVGVPDTDPPEDVTDLAAAVVNQTTVQLSWLAPAEDKSTGLNTATEYDIRYLEGATPIDDTNWATATEVTGEPGPQAPDSAETFDVTGLTPDIQYYFALKTVDDQGNVSENVSNSHTATTTDINPPRDITDLAITAFDEVSITLSWTAPGDDGDTGTATSYDIRYAEAPIANDTDWDNATVFGSPPTPQAVDSSETVPIDTGLTQGHHYYIRIKTADDKGNWSGMSNQVDQLLPCPACPLVSGIRPPAAPEGAVVLIDGSVFEAAQGTGTVEFNAASAAVLSWADTAIAAVVPADLSGPVTVTVTNNTGFSTTHAFDETPYITGIAPSTVTLPDATIAISGSGFGSAVDTITFTGTAVSYTPTGWTDTAIDVDIASGAQTGPLTVTVGSFESNAALLTITGAERTWSSPAVVDDDATPSVFPRAASDNGDMQIVWIEKDPLNVDLEILGKARVGGTWQGTVNISDTANDSSSVEIAVDQSGVFHLAYLDSGTTESIFYTSGKDATWITPEAVAAEAPDARPAVGVLPDGSVLVAWSTGGEVHYNLRDPAGSWGTAAAVPASITNAASLAGSMDPSGNFHIIFVNGADLVHAWFDGGAWNDGGAIATAAPGSLVALAADGLGILHALWWDTTLNYASRGSAGWTVGTEPAATATAPQALDLAVDAGDTLHAVVEDDSGTYFEILYFSMPPAGVWSAGETISNILADADSKQPCVVANQDLTLCSVWSESDRIRMVFWE
jgi:hypothetical protein